MSGAEGGPDPVAAATDRAEVLIAAGRAQEALDHAGRALAADPGSTRALCLASQAYLLSGRPDDALRAASDAVAQDPDAEWGHRLRSGALLALGRASEAVEAADAALERHPENWTTLVVLSSALVEAGRPDEGEIVARDAVELAPDEATAHVALGQALDARVPRRLGRWRGRRYAKAATTAYEAALQADPQHVGALQALALLNLKRGRASGATAGYSAAAALEPTSVGPAGLAIAVRFTVGVTARFLLPFSVITILMTAICAGVPVGGSEFGQSGRARAAGVVALVGLALLIARRLVRPWRAISDRQRPAVARRLRQDRWLVATVILMTACAAALVAFVTTAAVGYLGLMWLAGLLAWVAGTTCIVRLSGRSDDAGHRSSSPATTASPRVEESLAVPAGAGRRRAIRRSPGGGSHS